MQQRVIPQTYEELMDVAGRQFSGLIYVGQYLYEQMRKEPGRETYTYRTTRNEELEGMYECLTHST